jgi:nitrite reductase/ring-hydroxylating ferredoxin subunit
MIKSVLRVGKRLSKRAAARSATALKYRSTTPICFAAVDHLFYPACAEDDVPEGGKLRVIVEGYPVCLYRVNGTYYASGDPCPHELLSLADGGALDGEIVTCGAHRYRFNVRTGECYEDPGISLTRLPCGRKNGTVYVGFKDDEDAGE